jgi:thymidine kinase
MSTVQEQHDRLVKGVENARERVQEAKEWLDKIRGQEWEQTCQAVDEVQFALNDLYEAEQDLADFEDEVNW